MQLSQPLQSQTVGWEFLLYKIMSEKDKKVNEILKQVKKDYQNRGVDIQGVLDKMLVYEEIADNCFKIKKGCEKEATKLFKNIVNIEEFKKFIEDISLIKPKI